MSRLAELERLAGRLRFEPYTLDRPIDAQGLYQMELDPDFPFAIKLLLFRSGKARPPLTWHTYLELFILLSKTCWIQMGNSVIEISGGDVQSKTSLPSLAVPTDHI